MLRETDQRLAAVRRAVGDDIDVGLDPHARIFEPARALQLADVVQPYQPLFLEEPIRPENIAALGELRSRVRVPIATGEMLYTKYEFREVLAARAADIVQPDLLLCGGLLEAKKIAAMAEAEYVTVAPHSPLGPVSTAVATHFAASTGNFVILEYRPDQAGDVRQLVREPLKLVDGHIQIPTTPGLGIELNDDIYARFPARTWHRDFVTGPDGNVLYQ